MQRLSDDQRMLETSPASAVWRALTGRLLGILALGLMLAGCDKCNDWGSIFRSQASGPQTCKDDAPRQQ